MKTIIMLSIPVFVFFIGDYFKKLWIKIFSIIFEILLLVGWMKFRLPLYKEPIKNFIGINESIIIDVCNFTTGALLLLLIISFISFMIGLTENYERKILYSIAKGCLSCAVICLLIIILLNLIY